MHDWLVGCGTVNLSDCLIEIQRYCMLIYVTDPAHFKRFVQRYAKERVVKAATIVA